MTSDLADTAALINVALLAISAFAAWRLRGALRWVAIVAAIGSGIHFVTDAVSPLEDSGEHTLMLLTAIGMIGVAWFMRDTAEPRSN